MKPWPSFTRIGRCPLAWKFSLAALLIIISMGTGIYFIADTTIRQNLYDSYRQKGEAIVSNLATGAADLLLLDNSARLQLLLKNTELSNSDIVYIFIMAPKGKVPAHTFPGGFPDDLKKIPQPDGGRQFSSQLLDTGKIVVLDIAVPILQGSLGYAHAGFSLETIAKKRRLSQQQIFWTCVLASLMAIIISVLFSRHITKPLTALVQGADFIGKGNLAHRLDIVSHDEIGVTAKAFNQMAESLQNDIAKRMNTEKALKESEEIYRTLVENIDMGITLIDSEHTVLKVNAAQGRMFNKTPKEFYGKKCFEEFEGSDQVCTHCPGIAAMEKGYAVETIVQNNLEGGSTRIVNIKAFPVQSENGRNERFIEVIEDISERLEIQQDLAAEKERLSVTLRSIGDGVITTDVSGNIVLLNKVAENLTGWTNKEAFGRPLEEVFHIINEQTRERCENPVTKVLSSGQIVGLANHTALIAKDGRERSIADSGAPILDAKSNIIGVVLVFRDVTEQIKTEKELLKIKKLESIGVLAGGIAHDFNNILAAILGNIDLALYDPGLSEKTQKLLSKAEKATLRAKNLTQQLLTFAKGGEPVKETASLKSVIKDSAGFVLHGDKVACRYDIPEDLWLVDIDKGQISQVIQNIVLNASHAMPQGGTVSISCENLSSVGKEDFPLASKGRYVKILIQDSGIGIPANVLDKIFDPYFTTKREGSGLGLAITQSIVTKHNGYISVESTPGIGTGFDIYLPALEKTPASEQKSTRPIKASSPSKVLIMDDEEMVRSVAEEMLVQLGHDVDLASNGEEAIKEYQEKMDSGRPFDLVIMDLTIPGGLGGKEAVQEIRRIHPAAKVIVSSGYSNDPVMANFKHYGFCAAIVKPYQLQELSRVISELEA